MGLQFLFLTILFRSISVSESTIFPLPSNIPKLNDKNEVLCRMFRDVIISQARSDRHGGTDTPAKSPLGAVFFFDFRSAGQK